MSLAGLPNLEHLQLSFAKLNEHSLLNLTHLRVLSLSYVNMRRFSSNDFEALPNLESLSLDELKNNAHVSFHSLHRLRRLEVRHAQNHEFVHTLPRDLHALRIEGFDPKVLNNIQHGKLQVLDLTSYKLYSFDTKCLAGLTSLRHLRIKQSVLKTIKLRSAFLANLVTLSLENNHIEQIDLSKLVNLTWLNLSFNRKFNPHSSTFATQADTLEELYLSGCCFSNQKLSNASLSKLKQLRVLDLSENSIRRFDPKMFAGLSNLRQFSMRKNPVGRLEPKLLTKLFPKLEKIE